MAGWSSGRPTRSPRSSSCRASRRPSNAPATLWSDCTTIRSTGAAGRRTAAEASLRAARASAALDGAPLTPALLDTGRTPPPTRCWPGRCESPRSRDACSASGAPPRCRRWPGCTSSPPPTSSRSRNWAGPAPDPDVSGRLALLADLVTGGTAAPAPVVVAVVHGELLALAPFGSADGVVARAAARLAAVSTGLDPKGLAVPEVGHLRREREYRSAAAAFAAGLGRRGGDVGAALLRTVGRGCPRGTVDRRGAERMRRIPRWTRGVSRARNWQLRVNAAPTSNRAPLAAAALARRS